MASILGYRYSFSGFGLFYVKTHDIYAGFHKTQRFWVKLGSQFFQNIRLWFWA